MFSQRRNSQKASAQLIASFRKDYPSLPSLFANKSKKEEDDDADNPPQSLKNHDSIDDSSAFMSYDDSLSQHFGNFDDSTDDINTPGDLNYPFPTSRGADSGSLSYDATAAAYSDFPTPSAWQNTPSGSATGFYAPQMHHLQYSWPATFQPAIPSSSSRSASLPSSLQTHQPAFLSLQDVHLQPLYPPPSNFDAAASSSTSSAQAPQLLPPNFFPSSFRYRHDSALHASQSFVSEAHRSNLTTQQSRGSSQFRFLVTLLNGTAMVKDNEIPVSYLNKRQTYKIKIRDTRPAESTSIPTTYRTFVRVSFHEDKQRAHPDQHWQLWKEGRGMSEAQQHGGKLQAIEYVPSSQLSAQSPSSNVHVEKECFDGFCVTWTAPNSFPPECEVQFRCNFLSTDFSRSKGVKGIPVRLCAKSEVIAFPSMGHPALLQPEVCYCKIKLFRDHGAERKLTNDEAAIRRLVTKTEDQIKQKQPASADDEGEEAEYSPLNSSGKRRMGDSSPSTTARPSKIQKIKRASSVSSDASSQGQEVLEGDLPLKVSNLHKLLRSKQDTTVFFLPGEELDDPDVHPVSLLGSSVSTPTPGSPEIRRPARRNTQLMEPSAPPKQSPVTTNSVSPTQPNLQLPTPRTSHDWQPSMKHEASADSTTPHQKQGASPPTSLTRISSRARSGDDALQVADVDPNYKALSEELVRRPVACFYVQIKMAGSTNRNQYHRAIYIYERSVSSLVHAIAKKEDIVPEDIVETIYIDGKDRRGIQVQVDDEFVSHVDEGQDMTAELALLGTATSNQRVSSRRVSDNPPRYSLTIRY